MSIEINGVAHIQFTINDPERGLPFWESLCHFMGMSTLVRNDETVYCIGGRTGLLARAAPEGKRDKVLIATKVHNAVESGGPNDQGSSRQHIFQGIEASLKRLKTDYVDLYQLHRWDSETAIEESMRALDDLIRAGKVRYIGASNFTAWQLSEANAVARANGWTEFISIQPHYHMLERGIESELLPASRYFNIGVLPYFPLAGGFLTGKYQEGKAAPSGSRGESSPYVQKYMTPQNYALLDELANFAKTHQRTINDLAHAWLLAQAQVSSVISGATSVDQVLSNISAHDWELSEEDVLTVNNLLDESASSK